MAASDDGYIYVADTYNTRVAKFTSNGAFVLQFGTNGSGDGQFRFPYGIDVDATGHVYVGDLTRRDVQVFDSLGVFVRRFGAGAITGPFGLWVGDDGFVYVTDRPSHVIRKFDGDGALVSTFAPGSDRPQNIEGGPDGYLYVSDGAGLIWLLKPDGTGPIAFGSPELGNPTGAAFLNGKLYVTEYSQNRVSVFDPATRTRVDVLGDNEPFQLATPFDAASLGDSVLYILEAGSSTVHRFRVIPGVLPPQVHVISPNGGEGYVLGSVVPFAWVASSDGPIVRVALGLSRDGGSTWESIADSVANTGTYDWASTGPGSATCRLRVTAYDQRVGSEDVSDGDWRLLPPSPTVDLLAPNGGEVFAIGASARVRWHVTGGTAVATSTVQVSRDNGLNFSAVSENVGNAEAFDWDVSGPASEFCRVRVVYTNAFGQTAADTSNAGFAVRLLADPTLTYLDTFGAPGTGPGQLAGPDGIAVSDDGRVYVADTYNSRVQWFSTAGTYQGQFGSGGTDPGQLLRPYGIDVDAMGDVYVSDIVRNDIQKFSADGLYLGKMGSGTQILQPFGLWVSDEGVLYVTDRPARRVRLYSTATGESLGTWGPVFPAKAFSYPQNIEGDGCGLLYVSDGFNNFEVDQFDGTGRLLRSLPSFLGNNPTGTAISGSRLFTTLYDLNQMTETRLYDDRRVGAYGLPGQPGGAFQVPIDVAESGDSLLFVVNAGSGQIQRFRIRPLAAPQISVLQPNGGEVYLASQPVPIRWSVPAGSDSNRIDVLLSRDRGVTWSLLADHTPNDGEYDWIASLPASDHSLVRVISRDSLGAAGKDVSDAEFAIVGLPVPTLLVSLVAEEVAEGILVRWQLSDPGLQLRSGLERSEDAGRSFVPVTALRTEQSDGVRVIDTDVQPSGNYQYRVVADGRPVGTVAIQRGAAIRELEFAAPSPNPCERVARFDFALPAQTLVRLALYDVSGREVARLVNGVMSPGRHSVTWEVSRGDHRVAPGLYFARLKTGGGRSLNRRLIVSGR